MSEQTIENISFGESLNWPLDVTKELDLETMSFSHPSNVPRQSSVNIVEDTRSGSVNLPELASESVQSSNKYVQDSLLGEGGMAKVRT